MSNEAETPKMRKSIVRKSITRKYNTAKFETMDIVVDHSIEVEWDTIENLRAKSDSVTTLVANDFEQTAKKVFEDFRLTSTPASMNEAGPAKRGLSAEEKKDFDKLS